MHVVTVLFSIKPAHTAEFMVAMVENAQITLATEPGCCVFEVCESRTADACQVFLYEVYATPADFQLHLRALHFQQFNTLTAAWVIHKTVSVFQRVLPSA
jgi:(4S)-4-hydroxy-5-phosphonooxypentane-2,3-dione isomerase